MSIYRRVRTRAGSRRLATHLAVVFGAMVLVAMVIITGYVGQQTVRLLRHTSSVLFEHTVGESRAQIDKSVADVDIIVQLLADDPRTSMLASATQPAFIERMRAVLDVSPVLSAVYIGYKDGGFVILRKMTSAVARQSLGAPAQARYLLGVFTPQGRNGAPASREQGFLDDKLQKTGPFSKPDQDYDPRARLWYQAASKSSDSILTSPYWFANTRELGVTIARQLPDGEGVMGVDLSLADMSQVLVRMKSTPSSALLIVNDNNEILATSAEPVGAERRAPQIGDLPPVMATMLSSSKQFSDKGESAQDRLVKTDGREWVMRTVPLKSGPWTFHMLLASPEDELLADASTVQHTLIGIGIALIALLLLAIQRVARKVCQPLADLARDAEDISHFRFDNSRQQVKSSIREVSTLSESIRNVGITMQRFIEIGEALAAENDSTRLVGLLLQKTIGITGSEGGVMLWTEDGGQTLSIIAQDISTDGVDARGIEPKPLSAAQSDPRLLQALASRTVSHFDLNRSAMSPLLASLTDNQALMDGEIFRFTVIPLLNRSKEMIGGVLLVARVPAGAPVELEDMALARALSGNAAAAIETTLLLKARKSLLDAVIRMMAQSIDAKSPYTGGHCQRVPVLTEALTREVCEATTGPYADFDLSIDDWEAVEVAGWLHDCGKLTTAEYVVDKATKLETIYNRIHEIRMRFELLKAQAHVAYWKALAEGGDEAALRAARDAELAVLDEDFAFVAKSNRGGEAMAQADIDRLHAIGARKWLRTLDDRFGLSYEELTRKERSPAPALPAEEFLLANREDHVIAHHVSELAEMEDKAGFLMAKPQYRMNLGELHNLSINRGTLTTEERYEINRHITRSIVMMESLPLIGALKQVPEFAGGHHEKMDGTGYPRRLKGGDMSVVARVMAIADVFEALTAADRPYKKAKQLSEAIRIMGAMKRDRHLDPDLLDLFLTSGVWRRYAEAFLEPEQIDEPDIDAVLAIRPVAAEA